MNLFKRMTTLLLALSLVFALAACGEADKNDQGTADPTESGSTEPVTKLTDEELVEEYKKMLEGYTRELTGLEKDEVLFTVNGEGVTVEELLYQYTSRASYIVAQYLQQGTTLDLSTQTADGSTTVAQYLFSQAADQAAYYTMMGQKAVEYECELTDDQKKVWEDALAEYLKTNGEKSYYGLLATYGLSEDIFGEINLNEGMVQNVAAAVSPDPSEGDLDMYIADYDILRCKHILLNTVEKDDNGGLKFSVSGGTAVSPEGEAYSGEPDEVNKKILARAEEILKEINGADDPLAKFDELMHANSQDRGLAASPDGYTFTSGQMVEVFENTTRSLEYGEISEVVQSPYGYHIILRLRPDVRTSYIEGYVNMQITAWLSMSDIQTTELLDKLDPVDIYNKYTEYQNRLSQLEA